MKKLIAILIILITTNISYAQNLELTGGLGINNYFDIAKK